MILPEGFEQSLPLGDRERQEFLEALRVSPPVSVRINPFKAELFNYQERVPWCENASYLPERPHFTADPAFHAGAYYPQEASSMFLDFVVRQLGLDTYAIAALDLCGAPGGKATLLRSVLHDESLVWANEVVPKRAKILLENLQKWGHEGIIVSNADAKTFGETEGAFDLILVDAPCSGEGLFRKQPEAVNEWSPKAVENCAIRQRQIIQSIWPALKKGGVLIYSTCTFNTLENEENLLWLKNRYDAEFINLKVPFHGIAESEMHGVIGYRFWPQHVKGEGFFLSAIRKEESQKQRTKRRTGTGLKRVGLQKLLPLPVFTDKRDQVFMLSDMGMCLLEMFPLVDKVFSKGFPLGVMKGNGFKPNHGMAMWRNFNSERQVNLHYQEAINYLSCQDVAYRGIEKGKVVTGYKGFNLGFGKCDKNRIVSNYPKEFRIRHFPGEGYREIALPITR